MMRASIRTYPLLAATVLSAAACREIPGQCSSRTDTLCLQINLTDRSAVPDELSLSLSASGMSKQSDFANVASILSQRPYVVELALQDPPPSSLSIDATGYLSATSQKIATGQITLAPATAARPTILNLTPLGGSDLGSGGNQDMFPADQSPGADLRPTGWTMVYKSSGKPLTGISGTTVGGLMVMATGSNQLVVRGNGTTFTAGNTSAGNATHSAVWLASANSAWVCDRGGIIYSTINGGTSWTASNAIGYPLNGIYGRSTTDILAVGDSTISAAHWDGTSWKNVPHNSGVFMYGVWISNTTYYMAGGNGQGAKSANPEMTGSWGLIANLNGMTLRGMSGYQATDAIPLAVGDAGTVEYYQAITGKWVDLQFPNKAAKLTAAWVAGPGQGYVVGAAGTVYYFNSGAWSSYSTSSLTGYDLTGIWGDGAGGIWVSASNGSDGAIFKY